eukprot:6821337-Pyramimonas_sp.AAC.3
MRSTAVPKSTPAAAPASNSWSLHIVDKSRCNLSLTTSWAAPFARTTTVGRAPGFGSAQVRASTPPVNCSTMDALRSSWAASGLPKNLWMAVNRLRFCSLGFVLASTKAFFGMSTKCIVSIWSTTPRNVKKRVRVGCDSGRNNVRTRKSTKRRRSPGRAATSSTPGATAWTSRQVPQFQRASISSGMTWLVYTSRNT